MLILILAGFAVAALNRPTIAADWLEAGDAGQLPDTAQNADGDGLLTRIVGSITSKNDVDGFVINIPDLRQFSASTVAGAAFDTELFLFTLDGRAVLANDDMFDQNGNMKNEIWVKQSLIEGQESQGSGSFVVLISAFNNDPHDAGGELLFFDEPYRALRGPRPGTGLLTDWDGNGTEAGGFPQSYTITLNGAAFIKHGPLVPEPATLALLALGIGAVLMQRRRKPA